MRNKFQRQYCKGLVIVHGASEYQMAGYVKSKLRIPLEIYSRDNGRTSIQINGLMNILNNNTIFSKPVNFLANYDNIERSKGMPVNLCVFPIMDTDDCNCENIKEQYIDGSLFDKHWLKPYIVPIYNSPSVEDVMFDCKLIDKKLSDNEKLPTYRKLFPISGGSSNFDEIQSLRDRLIACKCTNIECFLDYCLQWAEDSRIKQCFNNTVASI